jgi:glycosyltransferase involved in cell wall biosynthesis
MSDETLPPNRGFKNIPSEVYVFYTINTWTERKAIWNTIRCFLDTFTADDPVALIVKTTAKDFTRSRFDFFLNSTRRAVRKLKRGYGKPARIHLITQALPDKEMLHLHARGDCYISLCRSEGWGMGAFDAAGFGKPIIMTGFGGQLDYLAADSSFLVDYHMIPVKDRAGKGSYSTDQNWAEPDIAHASRLMKLVFDDQKTAQKKGLQLGGEIKRRFSRASISEEMIRCIINHKPTNAGIS